MINMCLPPMFSLHVCSLFQKYPVTSDLLYYCRSISEYLDDIIIYTVLQLAFFPKIYYLVVIYLGLYTHLQFLMAIITY